MCHQRTSALLTQMTIWQSVVFETTLRLTSMTPNFAYLAPISSTSQHMQIAQYMIVIDMIL